MVVSDTSPLNYLILIEQINLLPQLYRRVLIPGSVLEELNAPATPNLVRAWMSGLPAWLEVSPHVACAAPAFKTENLLTNLMPRCKLLSAHNPDGN